MAFLAKSLAVGKLLNCQRQGYLHWHGMLRHTSLLAINICLDVGLLEWSPLEIFFVTAAYGITLRALLATGLFFATFQTLRLARQTSCEIALSVRIFNVENAH